MEEKPLDSRAGFFRRCSRSFWREFVSSARRSTRRRGGCGIGGGDVVAKVVCDVVELVLLVVNVNRLLRPQSLTLLDHFQVPSRLHYNGHQSIDMLVKPR